MWELDRRVGTRENLLNCDLSLGADWELEAKNRVRSRGVSGGRYGCHAQVERYSLHNPSVRSGEAKVSNNIFIQKVAAESQLWTAHCFLDYRMPYEWVWHQL